MNKILRILFLTLCIILSTVTYCYAEKHTSPITAEVTSTFIVEIPSTVSLPYRNPDSVECNINFSDVCLEEDHCLRVQILHDDFKLTKDSSISIPYTLDCNEALITEQNHNLSFRTLVEKSDIAKSPSGKYSSKITVIIECIKHKEVS